VKLQLWQDQQQNRFAILSWLKSLGLSSQEIKRLGNTTDKILKLELKKVKYVRSLSFIQGTLVNLLRNMILLLMLYLIFAGRISVGEFFSLFIYSFFIFGPLQELGNIINIYRETEVSLDNFRGILSTPKEKKPLKPEILGRINSLKFNSVSFKHQSANRYALENISFEIKKDRQSHLLAPPDLEKLHW
jgi:ATP-binding cassette, subfamily B, bacterial